MKEHPADILREASARLAFLEAAALAFCASADTLEVPDSAAWEGLCYMAGDIKRVLQVAAEGMERAA